MCGISGTAGYAARDLLARMTGCITHRGPDDVGIYISPDCTIGLGNRRLSILDLSPAGHMPMSNEDGSVWLTYNGEIYNFSTLRRELKALGHQFRSRTDTDVLLRGYEAWGTDVLGRLNGMFAFGIADFRPCAEGEAPRLVLARDRYGIKPLYYARLDNRLLFGSEIKSILQDPTVRRHV